MTTMAYTKIKAVKNHLKRCLDYAANPAKTKTGQDLQDALTYAHNSDKTEQQLFVTGFNCDPAHACEVMLRTETIWGKGGENHVLGYHVIQSFAPGEVTPKQAHEIGCEFARRAFAERYEATVSTHLNTGTLHNHTSCSTPSRLWMARCSVTISKDISRASGRYLISCAGSVDYQSLIRSKRAKRTSNDRQKRRTNQPPAL